MNDRETLVRAYKAGCLLEAIQAASLDRSEQTKLVSVLAPLHNEGHVDLIEAFGALISKSACGPDFFRLRQLFEETLPELEAPVPKAMQCVLHIYREADTGTILVSFREFCAKQADRPKAALSEIEGDPETLADLLIAVLVAGSTVDASTYVVETIRLSRHASIDLRRRALLALGMLKGEEVVWGNEDVAKALEQTVAAEDDDQVLANTIKSAFALSRHDAVSRSRWIAVISDALSKGDETSLYVASDIFGHQTRYVSPELLEILLASLAQVKPTNKDVLGNIDNGLAYLLHGEQVERGLQFLERLLLSYPQQIEVSNFDDVVRVILSRPDLSSKVATRWFLGGEEVLCEGVASVVYALEVGSLEIQIDTSELAGVDPNEFVFAARKAIGYLFYLPISATSFLLSLIVQAPNIGIQRDLESLLLNPLLLNFSVSVSEYLTRRAESDEGEVKDAVTRALKDLETYLEGLRSVGEIPALHPSIEHREAYHRHFSEEMAQSFRDTEEESVLLKIFPKSVLLYGQKAILHTFGPEGEIKRMETQLQVHGTEIEVPRMMVIDSHGLELMLCVFKRERRVA